MTKAHIPAVYLDGFVRVAFCAVCGAEGLGLLDSCLGVVHTIEPKPIDANDQTDKQKILKTGE